MIETLPYPATARNDHCDWYVVYGRFQAVVALCLINKVTTKSFRELCALVDISGETFEEWCDFWNLDTEGNSILSERTDDKC